MIFSYTLFIYVIKKNISSNQQFKHKSNIFFTLHIIEGFEWGDELF